MIGYAVRVVVARGGRPGLALVELSVVEQRYRAVLAVLAGATVTEVAASLGVSRQTVSSWKSRYAAGGLAGLADCSRKPVSCPHQASAEVEAAVCDLRRKHPRWGPRRIAHVLERSRVVSLAPSRMTVYRILVRHGLIEPGVRRRKRSDYKRWQREAPMQLWQMDIVGGVMLVDETTGELTEAKIVTGVDDHSRYCVIASVVARATGRAVCAAFAGALQQRGADRSTSAAGWSGGVRAGGAAERESAGGGQAVLARSGPLGADGNVLGRSKGDPSVDRRGAGQDRALASVSRGSGAARCPGRASGRAVPVAVR
ncbi:helix-turn-helix domain-containing protein [Streptomyces sp. NBC_01361]|nr:helix-turn-helix domain-containing protein [Streptomyces sp. NBC_01361]